MPTSSFECPVCNETLAPGASECPRCGFKLIGATEAFQPISDPNEEQDSLKLVPFLKVIKGPYNGQEFTMGKGKFTVGRDPACDLFLSNMTVSRLHSIIEIDDNGARIKDAGSTNGTWIDGNVVEEAPLVSGTHVQIGTFDMIFGRKPE